MRLRWSRLKAEMLACLTLQPERADAENVSTAVAPLPGMAAVAQMQSMDKPSVLQPIPLAKAASVHLSSKSAPAVVEPQSLTILYAADRGSSSGVLDVAAYIAAEAAVRGIPVKPAMALDTAALDERSICVVVCASGLGGVVPTNAAVFYDSLLTPDAARRMKGMRFALLGVDVEQSADQQPDMRAPNQLRQRLLACGAAELVPAGECGGSRPIDQVLETWVASLWHPLQGAFERSDGSIKAALPSLFDRLGGNNAVAAIQETALRRMQADWRVKRFLAGTQDATVQAHIAQWLAVVLGGPLPYHGPDPAGVFRQLSLHKGFNVGHLDTLTQHVAGAMAELDMPMDLIDGVLEALAVQRRLWN